MSTSYAIVVVDATSIVTALLQSETGMFPPPPAGSSNVLYNWTAGVNGHSGVGGTWNGTRIILPTPISDYEAPIQDNLDAVAVAWGYVDIRTAVTYLGDPNPQYAAEALTLRDWRSETWTDAYVILNAIDPENPPLIADVLAQLPPTPARPTP